jgi:hypothetical protein
LQDGTESGLGERTERHHAAITTRPSIRSQRIVDLPAQFALQPTLCDFRIHRVRFVAFNTSEGAPTAARRKGEDHLLINPMAIMPPDTASSWSSERERVSTFWVSMTVSCL